MPKKSNKKIKGKKIIKKTTKNSNLEKLLSRQTAVILNAVDERLRMSDLKINRRFEEIDKKFQVVDARFQEIDRRFQEMETNESQRFDRIMTNFDKLLKKTVDTDDEIEFIKLDINRIKGVVKEKLGVNLM